MAFHRLALLLIVTSMTALLAGCAGLSSKPPVSVAFSAGFTPPTAMDTSANVLVAATVTNDPAHAGVNWTISCDSDQCGSFITPNPVASGSPATYYAPDSISSVDTVTLTATSVTDHTKSVSAIVTITESK